MIFKKQGFLAHWGYPNRYRPLINSTVDLPVFFREIHSFFNLPIIRIEEEFSKYQAYSERMEYAKILGETKTLCLEEAFLLYLSAQVIRPRNFCEIGTQFGKSTRRILDIFNLLKLSPGCYCYDIVKDIRFVSDEEVCFIIRDLTHDFEVEVLQKTSPELLFLDAHPYELLKKIINEFVLWSDTHPSILVVHDCSSGLYRQNMKIPKDKPSMVSSQTGLWERHVLSEIFKVSDEQLNDLKTRTHRLKIFNTPHGIALIAPLSIMGTSEVEY